MVRDGRIDTLVVAFTDMQGRLMGKRVQAQAFLDGVIDHGAHFCTYLLGTDMEMNTPDGFALMNWETGYGDWIAEPVWDQPAGPALAARRRRSSCPTRSTRRPARRSRSRRGRSSSARSPAAADLGYAIKAGSEFEYYVLKDSWEELGRAAAGPIPEHVRLLQRGLPPPPGDQGRAAPPAAAQPDDRGARSRSSSARARPRPASTRSTSATTTSSSRPTGASLFKHGAKEIAYLNGWGITFMAKPDHRWTGSSGHLHMSVWDADRRARR